MYFYFFIKSGPHKQWGYFLSVRLNIDRSRVKVLSAQMIIEEYTHTLSSIHNYVGWANIPDYIVQTS